MDTQANPMNKKILLPQFIKMLTSNNIPVPKAMALTGKIYKDHNTPETLAELDELKLRNLGVDSAEDHKLVMSALRRAGYTQSTRAATPKKVQTVQTPAYTSVPAEKPTASTSSSPEKPKARITKTSTPKRKIKRVDATVNEFIAQDENEQDDDMSLNGAFDFGEVRDEEVLSSKYVVINRAPVMMAWATIVAERMHFSRDEALSIASAFTEMNAVTKGISLGIYGKSKESDSLSGAQPYVDLMGRRPLYRTQNGRWRGLSNGKRAVPSSAFDYISRSFRQTMPHILGAMALLADSYPEQELNRKAWGLYAEFRPAVNEWGSRSEVHCKTILNLRNNQPETQAIPESQRPITGGEAHKPDRRITGDVDPPRKKMKFSSVEEYEAFLDLQDTT